MNAVQAQHAFVAEVAREILLLGERYVFRSSDLSMRGISNAQVAKMAVDDAKELVTALSAGGISLLPWAEMKSGMWTDVRIEGK